MKPREPDASKTPVFEFACQIGIEQEDQDDINFVIFTTFVTGSQTLTKVSEDKTAISFCFLADFVILFLDNANIHPGVLPFSHIKVPFL